MMVKEKDLDIGPFFQGNDKGHGDMGVVFSYCLEGIGRKIL